MGRSVGLVKCDLAVRDALVAVRSIEVVRPIDREPILARSPANWGSFYSCPPNVVAHDLRQVDALGERGQLWPRRLPARTDKIPVVRGVVAALERDDHQRQPKHHQQPEPVERGPCWAADLIKRLVRLSVETMAIVDAPLLLGEKDTAGASISRGTSPTPRTPWPRTWSCATSASAEVSLGHREALP